MTEQTTKKFNPIAYLKEARQELGKVTWPTKKETLRYSAIVIGVTVALAVFFAILDWAFNLGLENLIKIT